MKLPDTEEDLIEAFQFSYDCHPGDGEKQFYHFSKGYHTALHKMKPEIEKLEEEIAKLEKQVDDFEMREEARNDY